MDSQREGKEMKGKSRSKIAVLLTLLLLVSSVFGSSAVFAETGDAAEPNLGEESREAKTYDFEDWITDAKLMVKTDSGDYEEITDQTVAKDAAARMEIEYKAPEKGDDGKVFLLYPGDTLEYQLPDTVKIINAQEGSVYDGPDEIGTYQITKSTEESGAKIRINLDDDFLTEDGRSGVTGMVSFDGKLNLQAGGTETETVTIKLGDVELTVSVKPDIQEDIADVKLVKDHSVIDGYKTKYKITITAGKNNTIPLTNLQVKDWFNTEFSNNKNYIPINYISYIQNSLEFDNANAKGITGVDVRFDDSKKEAYLAITGSMNAGDKLIIYYNAEFDSDIYEKLNKSTANGQLSASGVIRNTAKVTTAEGASGSDWEERSIFKTWIKKTGSVQDDGSIRYLIYANAKPIRNLKGWTFKDTIDENQIFDDERGLTVRKYDSVDNLVGQKLLAEETKQLDKDKNFWEYTEESEQEDGSGYFYTFEYYTYPEDGLYNVKLNNKITLYKDTENNGGSTSISVPYSLFSLTKALSGYDFEAGTLTWKSTLTSKKGEAVSGSAMTPVIPEGAVYRDWLGASKGHKHYFEESSMNLVLKDGDGTPLEAGEDYTVKLENKEAKDYNDQFTVTFLRDVKAPVTLTYASKGDFPNNDENVRYRNYSQLQIADEKWNADAYVDYYNSHFLAKSANNDLNEQERTFSWKLTVNEEKADFGSAKTVIKDSLPEGLEFVKGSVESPSSGVAANFSYDSDKRVVTADLQGISNKKAVLKIVTKITDEELFASEAAREFVNKAQLIVGSKAFPEVSAAKKVSYKPMTKELASYNENTAPYANYKLTVNKAGAKLSEDSGTIQVVDKMENTTYVPETLTVKNLKTGETLPESAWKLAIDSDNKGFKLTLPDETPLEITYKAYVSGTAGESQNLNNKAALQTEKEKVIEVESKNEMIVEQSKATATGNPKLTLSKVDAEDGKKYLQGAKFELYKIKELKDGEQASLDKANLELVDTYVSDEKGKVLFNNLNRDTYYCYQEVKAPEGYVVDETPRAFIILSRDSQITDIPDWVMEAASGLRLSAVNDYGKLKVTKKFQEEGEAAANGDYPDGTYYLSVYQNGKLVEVDGEPLTQAITVKDGKAAYDSVTFRVPLSETPYQVYETDKDGKRLTSDNDPAFYPNDEEGFIVTGEGTEIKVNEENTSAETAITNNRFPITEQKVTKLWEGDEEAGIERPASVNVQLYADGKPYGEPEKLTADEGWTHTWRHLEKKAQDGKQIEYTVKELDADGNPVEDEGTYDENYTAFYAIDDKTGEVTITNYHQPEQYMYLGQVHIRKDVVSGEGENAQPQKVTDTFYVALFEDKELTAMATDFDGNPAMKEIAFKGSSSEEAVIDNMPVGPTNHPVTYYVAEVDKDGNPVDETFKYQATVANGAIRLDIENCDNKEEPAVITNAFGNQISVSGTKTWVDDDESTRPESIELILQQNGRDYVDANGDKYMKTVTAEDGWTYTFENLPEYDAEGKAYEYSVKEGYVEGYTSETDGMDVVNTQDYVGYYYEGTIRITKEVMLKDEPYNVKDVYYAGIFNDKDYSDPLMNEDGTQYIVPLTLNDECETEIEISVPFNKENSAEYYITEVDENGVPVEKVNGLQYKASIQGSKILLDTDDTEGSVKIVNTYDKEKAGKSGRSGNGKDTPNGSGAQTGDNSDMTWLVLTMLAALTLMGILALNRKRKHS